MKRHQIIMAILLAAVLMLQACGCALADEDSLVRAFVERCYQVILGRSSDAEGLEHWTYQLYTGKKGASEIVAEFISSREFQAKSYSNSDLIDILYKAMLNRAPDADGKTHWLESMNAGSSYRQIISGFSSSTEFKDLCRRYGIVPGSVSSGSSSAPSKAEEPKASAPSVDIEKIRAFVTRCYSVILGRSPDAHGLEDWTGQLATGKKTAAEIIDGFIGSNEFQSRHYNNDQVVETLYNAMLNRGSDANGKQYWVSKMNAGSSYKEIINGFCGSIEFRMLCSQYGITPGSVKVPTSNTAQVSTGADIAKITAFVTRCYRVILGREPDQGGLSDWTNQLAAGKKNASEIIYGFMASNEFRNKRLSNDEIVETLYKAMLDRGSDAGGKAYWLGKLKNGGTIATLINGFCGSTEFNKLCAEYGIKPGSVSENGVTVIIHDKDESVSTGLKKISGKWYYIYEDGSKHTGWLQLGDKKYYFDGSGVMQTDWVKINGVWYFFNDIGVYQKEGPQIGRNTLVDLTGQKDINKDFVAWMKVPGTNIDYPVVSSDDVNWYMDHNFTGQKSKDGTLLSLGKCSWKQPSQNIVIYGHHVEGSGDRMFKALLKYKKASYYSQHPVIYLDSLYMDGRYRIFAVFDMIEGTIDPSVSFFVDSEEFMNLISFAKSHSYYDTGVTVNANDKIITLVTCDRYFKPKKGRLIVMAVRE